MWPQGPIQLDITGFCVLSFTEVYATPQDHMDMSRYAIYAALAAALLFIPAYTARADIYKFVDDSGTIHFSNTPEAGYKTQKVVKEKPQPRRNDGPVLIPNYKLKGETTSYVPGAGEAIGDDVPYADIINDKCKQYGVDTQLVKAIIKAESDFNPNAVSDKGAVGLMQLMPQTAADLNVKDRYDPEQNIDGGVRYMRYLLDNFGGDVELSVAAYNCGEGRVLRNGRCVPDIKETKSYVKKVLKLSNNPITGAKFSRPIYRVELDDGTVMFTDSPMDNSDATLVH
jgi:Transglycosylase SLT domain/Domain of unknown function (DUF4124)